MKKLLALAGDTDMLEFSKMCDHDIALMQSELEEATIINSKSLKQYMRVLNNV
jgi:hypothetical protein